MNPSPPGTPHQVHRDVSSETTAPVLTLLNVEDFAPSRFVRTRILRDAGYDVIEAASAGEALHAAMRHAVAGALIDVNLPDASGIELCGTLRRLNPALAVLLISAGSLSAEAMEAGLAAGANAYLGEPVASQLLVRSVGIALNGESRQTQDCETWVVTNHHGSILYASGLGARLLSGTPRGLKDRNLIVFFEQDRDQWRDAMARASCGDRVLRSGRLRPREHRPIPVRVQIEKADDEMPPALLWTFRGTDQERPLE
jgi:CheY-like chemotaxis protein